MKRELNCLAMLHLGIQTSLHAHFLEAHAPRKYYISDRGIMSCLCYIVGQGFLAKTLKFTQCVKRLHVQTVSLCHLYYVT